ncbi:MAG: sulfite exporter TauE/SafE family protein [Alphaproteobacteria bacterium]|nr:sulfite exporter TauE/SafE family protein [Alphaproteobacteria bacterium]MBV8410700.1 sulfite exporter TauE/SafE family protein [Alphaproteobacteria bacterium]
MTVGQVLVIAAAFVVAGIAKGAIGMGLPPIALAVMSFAVPLEDALALMVVPSMATNVWQAIWGRDFIKLMRRFWGMALTSVASLLFVALTFGHLGSPTALAWVGAILVVYAALALTAWRPRVSRAAERWANPLIGLLSGAVAGVTGVAAVPFLPYMQSLDIDRHELVQALGIMFMLIIGALTLALVLQGAFDLGNTVGALAAIVPTFAGVWLGQRARLAVSAETFRRIFLLGMFLVGLHMARGLL